jgi:hypothetical protein
MEIWKDIEGYKGYYQVSNLGKIKAIARIVLNKHGQPQRYPEKFLKYDISDMGCSKYYRVTLSRDHEVERCLVHRLIAKAFIPNPFNKEFINHIDNNGENNQISNLEWCTHSENMIHSQKQGRLFNTQSKAGKLSGEAQRAKRQKTFDALVGTNIFAWKILNSELEYRGKKCYILCQCDCGTLRKIETSRLLRGESQRCSSSC